MDELVSSTIIASTVTIYPATFSGLGFKRPFGHGVPTVTSAQQQRAAKFFSMKKRKHSLSDHQDDNREEFLIANVVNEARLAASFINVNVDKPKVDETLRQGVLGELGELKDLLEDEPPEKHLVVGGGSRNFQLELSTTKSLGITVEDAFYFTKGPRGRMIEEEGIFVTKGQRAGQARCE